jgi:hypothetical protein
MTTDTNLCRCYRPGDVARTAFDVILCTCRSAVHVGTALAIGAPTPDTWTTVYGDNRVPLTMTVFCNYVALPAVLRPHVGATLAALDRRHRPVEPRAVEVENHAACSGRTGAHSVDGRALSEISSSLRGSRLGLDGDAGSGLPDLRASRFTTESDRSRRRTTPCSAGCMSATDGMELGTAAVPNLMVVSRKREEADHRDVSRHLR